VKYHILPVDTILIGKEGKDEKRYNKLNVGCMWGNKKANLLIYKGLASKKVVPLGLQISIN
jgi:hypothetical protein